MTKQPLRLLVVDDEASLRNPLAKHLRDKHKYYVEAAATFVDAMVLARAAEKPFDVALIDDVLVRSENEEPESLGVALMQSIRDQSPSTEFILFTGWGLETGLDALRAGAFRFIRKPFDLEELGFMIEHAANYRHLKETAHEKRILERLMESGTALLSGLGLADVLHTIARGVQSIGFDRVRLYLLSDDRRFLIGRAHAGMDSQFLGLSILVDSDPYMQDLLNLPEPTIFERNMDRSVPYEQVLAKETIDQWACVPLMLRGEVIGKLSVDNQISRRPLVKEELGPVGVFAAQAAAAIESARLREEEQRASQKAERRARNLEAIQQVSYALKTSLDLEQTLVAACRAAVELFGVDHSGMVMFEPDFTRGRVVAEYPSQTGTVGTEIPLVGVPQEQRLISTREPVVVEDVAEEVTLGPVRDRLLDFRIRSTLIVPVVFQENLLGSFSLDAVDQLRTFSTEEVDLCKVFASQVAPAIANAQLFAKTIHQLEQLETLRQTTLVLTSQLDRNATLDAIIQRAVSLLGAKGGGIYEYNPECEELTVVADHGHQADLVGRTLKKGEGMVGRLVANQEPHMIVSDYQKWSGRAVAYVEADPIGSVLGVLLTWQGRIVGVLFVNDEANREFSADDITLLRLFADHAAIALANARLMAQLRERAAHWKRLISNSPMAVIANDREGNITGFNDRALSVLGYQQDEILGKSVEIIYSNPQEPGDIGNLLRASPEERLVDHETLLRSKMGEIVPVRLAATWIRDEFGEAIGAIGSFEDLREIRNAEQRLFAQSAILDRITNYIQSEEELDKIFFMVLTGITAEFGLRLNRAALFLLNPTGTVLVGRMGIGHMETEEAWADWADIYAQGLIDFRRFRERLQNQPFPTTPVGERIRGLALPLGAEEHDIFAEVVRTGHWASIESETKLSRLSENFRKVFQPQPPLVVVALRSRKRVIGVLVADNKFTQHPITDETAKSLCVLANTAAIAIDNRTLVDESKRAHERLEASFKASTELVSSQDPSQVLKDIVSQARQSAGAAWVSIILIDEAGHPQGLELDGIDRQNDIRTIMRSDGISMEVMRTGHVIRIENAERHRREVNPSMFRDGIASALCLPFSLLGERIGVMWIHYREPRHFPEYEVNALQLYANQAAMAYDSARRLKKSEQMHQAAEALAGATDMADVQDQIVQHVRDILSADSAVLWPYDDEHNRILWQRASAAGIHGELWDDLSGMQAYAELISALVQPGWVGIEDVLDANRYPVLDKSIQDRFTGMSIRSFQVVMLSVGTETLGVLCANYQTPRKFSQEERNRTETFANHAALSLQKARLLEQVTRARNTATIVARAMITENLDETLHAVARGTVSTLNCDAIALYVYDQRKGKLQHPPTLEGVWYPERAAHLPEVKPSSIVYEMLELETPHFVEDVNRDPLFGHRRFAMDEKIASCAAVPLKAADERVGVMFVNYRTPHRFSSEELTNIQLLSNQAAVAIRSAQLYKDLNRRVLMLQALYEAGQVVTASLDLEEILHRIAEQARRLVGDVSFSSIMTVNGTEGTYIATYPREELAKIHLRLGKGFDLQYGIEGRIGIMGRAIATGQPQLVKDVAEDPDYLASHDETRSELAMPITAGADVIGAINVEHSAISAFDLDDMDALAALARQAALAIQNARSYEELRKTKGLVGVRTALAWMGMTSSAWQHAIRNHAITIQERVQLLEMESSRGTSPVGSARLTQHLSAIREMAEKILDKPITSPLSSEEGVESTHLDMLIGERSKQLQTSGQFQAIDFELDIRLPDDATVRASPEWLRRAFDVLVDNARRAVVDSEVKRIAIGTRLGHGGVEIVVKDTGPGIAEVIREKIGKERIENPRDAKGLGMGLLMAQLIVETFGGEIRVEVSSAIGTTMVIWLPLEQSK